ncbi:PREDICTED: putative BTB/POZ domain-containing protein At2g40450 [Tarenaya hassleriana]|uniref:putative BTB/POZ domain-containing protein At2g40450 n=1 Tax=Tarenaya hassleriana TaxID=28532 RepID=UPI0008FCF3A3|nr:PREDICTED: putative BTB/POZ domain-containing protein At2g40450 [Tarenaya hassleriana]
MFEKDEFKRSVDSVITIDLLDQEGLEAFLEFMYRGTLPHEKLRTHIRKLYGVAIAYEFPHLHDFCGNFLTSSLASYNALAIAELASICKDKVLKDAAFRFVIENADVIPSHLFKEFFERNSGLAVDLIKEFREEIKVFSFCNSMFEKFFNSFK